MLVATARILLFLLDGIVRSLINLIAAIQNFLIQSLEEPLEPEPENGKSASALLDGLPQPLQDDLSEARISLLDSTCLIVSPVETGYADAEASEDECDRVYLGALLYHLRYKHQVKAVVVQEPGQTIRFLHQGDAWRMLRVAA